MLAARDHHELEPLELMVNITDTIHNISPRPVGYGGYSDIYTAVWSSMHGDMKVAIKVIRAAPRQSKSGKLPRALRREIAVWKRLLHPNIHFLCGYCEGFGVPALVSPWYENGDINEYVQLHSADPDVELMKLRFFAEIVTGLEFLHDNQIVHGDLKGGNVLISVAGVARLCDFGLSHLLHEHSQSTTSNGGQGTARWMAPELLLIDGAHHSYASDVWACGCLFIEVWSNVVPYHDKVNNHQVILALSRSEPPSRPSDMTDAIWTIVQECCDFDTARRPSPVQVHKYLSLHLTMPRVYPMVTRDRPVDSPASELLKEIEASLGAADLQQLSELSSLSGADLAVGVVRIFGLWSLTSARPSPLFENAVLHWCLAKVGVKSLHIPPAIALPGPDDDEFLSEFNDSDEDGDEISGKLGDSHYRPAELRPLARLLERACPGLAETFMTHFATPVLSQSFDIDMRLSSVALFPDGNRIAVGCGDATIRVLDLATGATLRPLVGHANYVNQVAVSPNGRLVASCSDDRSIRLWDAVTGHAIGAPLVGHNGHVCYVDFSPDSRHIVSGSTDKTIRIWSTETCATVFDPLRGHSKTVNSVVFAPDGSRIVSGSRDGTIRIWDARTSHQIMTLRGHTDWVRSVAYSRNGLRIVSGSDDCTVRIRDITTGQQVGSPLKGHSGWVRSVAYSPDGTQIVSGSGDHTIRIWDAPTGAPIATLRGHTGYVLSVAFSPDGRRLASASLDGTVCIWDATDDWGRWDI